MTSVLRAICTRPADCNICDPHTHTIPWEVYTSVLSHCCYVAVIHRTYGTNPPEPWGPTSDVTRNVELVSILQRYKKLVIHIMLRSLSWLLSNYGTFSFDFPTTLWGMRWWVISSPFFNKDWFEVAMLSLADCWGQPKPVFFLPSSMLH